MLPIEEAFRKLAEEILSPEAVRRSIIDALQAELSNKVTNLKRRTKKGEDLRINLKPDAYESDVKDDKAAKNALVKIVGKLKSEGKIPKSFRFVRLAPKDDPEGTSGTFATMIFEYDVNGEKQLFKMVNSLRVGRIVSGKALTPNKIFSKEVFEREYNTKEQLMDDLRSHYLRTEPESASKDYVKYLIELAKKKSPSIDLDEIKTVKVEVIETDEPTDLVEEDRNAALTDFGEAFVGLVLANNNYVVGFPKSSHEKLIDLKVKRAKDKTDIGIGVSVKKDWGAKASVGGLIERIDDLEKQSPGILKKFKGAKVFKIIKEAGTVIGIPLLGAHLAQMSDDFAEKWEHFKSFVTKYSGTNLYYEGLKDTKAERIKLAEMLMKAMRNLEKKYPDQEEFLKRLNAYRKKMGQKKELTEYKKHIKTRWAQILYSLRIAIVNHLNEDDELREQIKSFLSKLAIKQIHLFRLRNGLEVDIVSFGATDFNFRGGGASGYEPTGNKISFSIKTR